MLKLILIPFIAAATWTHLRTVNGADASDSEVRSHARTNGQAKLHEPHFVSPTAGSPNSAQSRLNNPLKTPFADDAMRLCAILEGWSGATLVETEDHLGRMYISYMLTDLPNVSDSEKEALIKEFKPQIVDAFRGHAAKVLREMFSNAELSELLAFYKTPLGRKYAAAYPGLIEKMSKGDLNRQILRENLLQRIREKFPNSN